MTPAGKRHSLGRRLSAWLAWQALAGLALVSVVVYATIFLHLESRQAQTLANKRSVVAHLLEEARSDGDLAGLRHRLDDFLAGHDDLVLALHAADGTAIYASAATPAAARTGTVEFAVPPLAGTKGPVTASLSLHTQADDTLLKHLAAALAVSTLAWVLAMSTGSYRLVRLGLKPVQKLVDQTQALAADQLGRRLDGSGQPEELQPLVAQFNDLLDRVERAHVQLEGFNADVAHELNTPLTTLIASTELALRESADAFDLRELLASQLEELRRMTAIVRDMLFLSQADHGARARREPVPSLAAVAADVTAYHEAALADSGLRVEVHGDVAGRFDAPLLKRAISNLLGNATRYADRGSVIRIEIGPAGPGRARLAVTDRGTPVPPEHLPRLFDRFHRVEAARPHAEAQHGLGLSIVAAIARMHGGSAFAESGKELTTVGLIVRQDG
ncbi:MAG: heavy metal sensor histidine kinase [Burkholderiales bacterium]|nr:heavy metal sensor histidine kinase [Burkholderiales bacterium]